MADYNGVQKNKFLQVLVDKTKEYDDKLDSLSEAVFDLSDSTRLIRDELRELRIAINNQTESFKNTLPVKTVLVFVIILLTVAGVKEVTSVIKLILPGLN